MDRGWLRRYLDWLSGRVIRVPEGALASPIVDDELATEMASVADEAASRDDRLNYSIDSLAVAQDRLRSGSVEGDAVYVLGAYVGEVLVRGAKSAAWGWPARRRSRPRKEPAVVVGKWYVDPFEWVILESSGKAYPEESLADKANLVQEYAADPSFETAEQLGLRTRRLSNSQTLRDDWQRRRLRRLRREH